MSTLTVQKIFFVNLSHQLSAKFPVSIHIYLLYDNLIVRSPPLRPFAMSDLIEVAKTDSDTSTKSSWSVLEDDKESDSSLNSSLCENEINSDLSVTRSAAGILDNKPSNESKDIVIPISSDENLEAINDDAGYVSVTTIKPNHHKKPSKKNPKCPFKGICWKSLLSFKGAFRILLAMSFTFLLFFLVQPFSSQPENMKQSPQLLSANNSQNNYDFYVNISEDIHKPIDASEKADPYPYKAQFESTCKSKLPPQDVENLNQFAEKIETDLKPNELPKKLSEDNEIAALKDNKNSISLIEKLRPKEAPTKLADEVVKPVQDEMDSQPSKILKHLDDELMKTLKTIEEDVQSETILTKDQVAAAFDASMRANSEKKDEKAFPFFLEEIEITVLEPQTCPITDSPRYSQTITANNELSSRIDVPKSIKNLSKLFLNTKPNSLLDNFQGNFMLNTTMTELIDFHKNEENQMKLVPLGNDDTPTKNQEQENQPKHPNETVAISTDSESFLNQQLATSENLNKNEALLKPNANMLVDKDKEMKTDSDHDNSASKQENEPLKPSQKVSKSKRKFRKSNNDAKKMSLKEAWTKKSKEVANGFQKLFLTDYQFDLRILTFIQDLLLFVWVIKTSKQMQMQTKLLKNKFKNVKGVTATKKTLKQKLFRVLPFKHVNIVDLFNSSTSQIIANKSPKKSTPEDVNALRNVAFLKNVKVLNDINKIIQKEVKVQNKLKVRKDVKIQKDDKVPNSTTNQIAIKVYNDKAQNDSKVQTDSKVLRNAKVLKDQENVNQQEAGKISDGAKIKAKFATKKSKSSTKKLIKKADSGDKIPIECAKNSKKAKQYLEELRKIRKEQRQILENMRLEKQKLMEEMMQERNELKTTLIDVKNKFETQKTQDPKPRICLKRKASPADCRNVDQIIERAVIQGVNSELMKEHQKQLSKYYKTKQEFLNRRLEISNLLRARLLGRDREPSKSEGNLGCADARNETDLLDSMINVAIKKIKRMNNGRNNNNSSDATPATSSTQSIGGMVNEYPLNIASCPDVPKMDKNDLIVARNHFKLGLTEKCGNPNGNTLFSWVFGKKAVEIKKKDDGVWYIRREIFKQNLPGPQQDPTTSRNNKITHSHLQN